MSHYPNLEPSVRERLAALGIDPEKSTSAMLLAIRDGSFTLRRPRNQHGSPGEHLDRWQPGIPLAVVLTEEESAARTQWKRKDAA